MLRVPAEGRGEALAVFSAEWFARGYLLTEALGGGWHARAYAPGALISLLTGPGAGIGWVAFDPRPGSGGTEAPNVMPRESFVDYLRGFALRPRCGEESEARRGDVERRRSEGDREVAWPRPLALPSPLVVSGTKRACGWRWPSGGVFLQEVSTVWEKLFGGDRLPRAKVDAVVAVIDRYLSEEARLRGLQSERQTIHPKDLPPDKRRALIEEVFAILGDTGKK
ncbi:MAG: hypothetical protein IN808_03625 [Rubrobacter sp.]|nr:hypothetical protein [Rubrobacter sp.]